MLKLSLLAVALFASAPSAHALQGPADELRSLRNVINNNVPERYRDQLNGSLARLEVAIQDGCSAKPAPRDNGAPQCTLAYYDGGYYKITKKDGGDLTQWNKNLDETFTQLDSLIAARQCSSKPAAEPCELAFYDGGYYSVKRSGSLIAPWVKNMAGTLEFMASLQKRGICQ